MIKNKFIHELDYLHEIEETYTENKKYFREKELDLTILIHKRNQNELFMESSIDTDEVITEGVKDIVDKVGKKIIEIVDSVIKYINDCIEKIREWSWKRKIKDKDKVLEKLKEERPDIATKVKVMVDSGKIDLADFNTISNFYKSIDNTLNEIEKADEKSLKGKIARAKDDLSKTADVIIKIGAVAGAAATCFKLFKDLKEYTSRDRDKKIRTLNEASQIAKATGTKISNISIDIGNGAKMTLSPTKESVIIEAGSEKMSSDQISVIKEKQSFISFISNLYSKVTKKVVSDYSTYINTMDNAVERAIRIGNKGGE